MRTSGKPASTPHLCKFRIKILQFLRLCKLCARKGIPVYENDRLVEKLREKENCFVIGVVRKSGLFSNISIVGNIPKAYEYSPFF